MHGNVLEWCSDFYGAYPEGAVSDPIGPKEGGDRVYRGGFWGNEAAYCRSANRLSFSPSIYTPYGGFRVALSPSGTPKQAE